MGASIAIRRDNTFYALEGYYTNQGFWKQANFVKRMPPSRLGVSQLAPEAPYFARDAEGRLDCGSPGSKQAFKSMLDSETTYPTLHLEDLFNLGVDMAWYDAQIVQTMDCATGPITSRICELHVCVLDNDCKPGLAVIPNFWY
jgi:hypothetical protein